MYKNRKILGFIPARGGSKGLPRKNIRSLLGKPLLSWTIEQANKSRYFDRVIISTDDQEICSVAKSFRGDVPFLRPKALATDKSQTIDAIIHAVDFLKKEGQIYDYLALIEPTSPLRKDGDLDRAVKKLIDNEKIADALVSVGEIHMEHPCIVKKIKKGFVVPYVLTKRNIVRRQDLDKAFFPYGVIYVAKLDRLLETRTFYQKRTIAYEIERWQNYEIDDLVDFVCIESILSVKNKERLR
ncbi:acylneuraminate cytidylyltransferase family protein [bacterium]|nr:MAG: acylneuraminate cytidylyltransferase family protein [bacterium]